MITLQYGGLLTYQKILLFFFYLDKRFFLINKKVITSKLPKRGLRKRALHWETKLLIDKKRINCLKVKKKNQKRLISQKEVNSF